MKCFSASGRRIRSARPQRGLDAVYLPSPLSRDLVSGHPQNTRTRPLLLDTVNDDNEHARDRGRDTEHTASVAVPAPVPVDKTRPGHALRLWLIAAHMQVSLRV